MKSNGGESINTVYFLSNLSLSLFPYQSTKSLLKWHLIENSWWREQETIYRLFIFLSKPFQFLRLVIFFLNKHLHNNTSVSRIHPRPHLRIGTGIDPISFLNLHSTEYIEFTEPQIETTSNVNLRNSRK